MAISLLLGLVFFQIPAKLAYAHTFSGNESAGFIATVGVIRTEIMLINSTVATNSSQANEHAKIAVQHLGTNDTSELAERNKRIATDLPQDLSQLQNMTANLSPTNVTGIAAVKQKVSDTDALLGEALSVRVEPTQLTNATVYGTAVADLLNETLERYGEALGIGANTSTSATTTSSSTTSNNASMSNNAATVLNYADYQSTRGLVNMTSETFNKTKSLIANSASTGPVSKIGTDLDQLKNLIDNKTSYSQVTTFVYNTIYPDLNSALSLNLSQVDVNKAIQSAMSGEE
jgi:hypothetical protein